jgi:hypothetical protein
MRTLLLFIALCQNCIANDISVGGRYVLVGIDGAEPAVLVLPSTPGNLLSIVDVALETAGCSGWGYCLDSQFLRLAIPAEPFGSKSRWSVRQVQVLRSGGPFEFSILGQNYIVWSFDVYFDDKKTTSFFASTERGVLVIKRYCNGDGCPEIYLSEK